VKKFGILSKHQKTSQRVFLISEIKKKEEKAEVFFLKK